MLFDLSQVFRNATIFPEIRPTIPKEHKHRFLQEVYYSNFVRMRVILAFLVALVCYELYADFRLRKYWDSVPAYRYFYRVDIVLACVLPIFILLSYQKRPLRVADTERHHQILVSSFAFFMLLWCSVVASIEHLTSSGFSTYVIGVFAVATGGYFRGSTLFLMYAFSLATLFITSVRFQSGPIDFFPDYMALLPLTLLAWIISRLLFAARVNDFVSHVKISEANETLMLEVVERKRAQSELRRAHDQLEQRVKDRTAELVSTNEQLRNEIAERKRIEEQLIASLSEKDVLIKEVHHRVKNNMQVISSLLGLQSRSTQDENTVEMLRESIDRIKSMALVHEKLYFSENLAKIDLKEYIEDLVSSLSISYGMPSDRITSKIRAENIHVGLDTAIPCALILNELVSNPLKHAFPMDRKGEIRISAGTAPDGEIEILFSDNGIGIPEEVDIRNTPSLGLKLIAGLVEHQLGGRLEFHRIDGTEFRITFKES